MYVNISVSSSRMRSGVVIFVSSLEHVNTICSHGSSGNGGLFEAQCLVSIPKKLVNFVKLYTLSSKYAFRRHVNELWSNHFTN